MSTWPVLSVKPDSKHKCANCDWIGTPAELKEIKDFWERITAGGTVPTGECPKCGAFAYPHEEPKPEKYPECEKLTRCQPMSQKCGEFIEWLEKRQAIRFKGHQSLPQLLGKFFEIDENKLEKERREMLDDIRKQNGGA